MWLHTRQHAEFYCGICEKKGELDALKNNGMDVLYLVLIASKLFEYEGIEIWDLDDEWDVKLKRFDQEHFIDNEAEWCRKLDWNFYYRKEKKK